jgi:hypothetical protein
MACCQCPDPVNQPGNNPKLVITLPLLLFTTYYYLLLHSLPAVANKLSASRYMQHATGLEFAQLSVPMAPSALTTRP